MRPPSRVTVLSALVLAIPLLALDASAGDAIPGPPLEPAGLGAPSFCPSRQDTGPADAAGFGLAALAAVVLLRRSKGRFDQTGLDRNGD